MARQVRDLSISMKVGFYAAAIMEAAPRHFRTSRLTNKSKVQGPKSKVKALQYDVPTAVLPTRVTLDLGLWTRDFQSLPVQSHPPDQNQTLLSRNKARRPERA